MSFWSGETLLKELPKLISPFSPDRIDCAAYTLTIGREYYVSPTDTAPDPKAITIGQLADGQAFTIPPGQFAFLLSDEIVVVPNNAVAFISIKATIKFGGLVNVSGFHVDPGFKGRLIFSVFNAGPVTIHLKQGQPAFLIWYASLDRQSEKVRNRSVQMDISPNLITGISGELHSLEGLAQKIKDAEKKLEGRVHAVEREQTYFKVIGVLALAVVTGLVSAYLKDGAIGKFLFGPSMNVVVSPPTGVPAPTPSAPPPSAQPGKS